MWIFEDDLGYFSNVPLIMRNWEKFSSLLKKVWYKNLVLDSIV